VGYEIRSNRTIAVYLQNSNISIGGFAGTWAPPELDPADYSIRCTGNSSPSPAGSYVFTAMVDGAWRKATGVVYVGAGYYVPSSSGGLNRAMVKIEFRNDVTREIEYTGYMFFNVTG